MDNKQVVEDLEENKNIADFIEALLAVDSDGPLAKLNETTISDNNGGRIAL